MADNSDLVKTETSFNDLITEQKGQTTDVYTTVTNTVEKKKGGKIKQAVSKTYNSIKEHSISTEDTEFETLIYEYLDTVNTEPLLHWGVIATDAAAVGNRRFNHFTASDWVIGKIPYADKLKDNKAVDLINYLLKITMDPNIEGIPIGASQITMTRDVDISESCFIVPDKHTKEYRADNSVPRLREWSISGYLATMSSFADYGLVIKPTILVQMKLLDTYAKSRRPVWFKSNNGSFHRVQIKHLQITQDPTMMNGAKIEIQLKEYFPIMVTTTLRSSSTSEQVSEEEAKTSEPNNQESV